MHWWLIDIKWAKHGVNADPTPHPQCQLVWLVFATSDTPNASTSPKQTPKPTDLMFLEPPQTPGFHGNASTPFFPRAAGSYCSCPMRKFTITQQANLSYLFFLYCADLLSRWLKLELAIQLVTIICQHDIQKSIDKIKSGKNIWDI